MKLLLDGRMLPRMLRGQEGTGSAAKTSIIIPVPFSGVSGGAGKVGKIMYTHTHTHTHTHTGPMFGKWHVHSLR